MNENVKWGLIAAIPMGIAMIIMSPNFTVSNPSEFIGGVCGAVFVWFLIFYVALQYAINRPEKNRT